MKYRRFELQVLTYINLLTPAKKTCFWYQVLNWLAYSDTHIAGKNLHEHMSDPYISYRKISDIYSVLVHCFVGNDNCTSDFTEIIEIHVHV